MMPFAAADQHPGREGRIAGEEFLLPGRWAGYAIPAHFPVRRAAERDHLLQALWTLVGRLHGADAQPGVWLLMDTLHKDDAVLTLSRNAREWRPSLGLGIWPDRPAPRTMTSADLLDLEWGMTPRRPYHSVTRLGAAAAVLHTAWTAMFGLGSSILTLGPGGPQRMLEETRATLTLPITDEGFEDFPFYFPLLDKKALATCTAEQLDGWLGSTGCYLRESEEDKAILLLSRTTPLLLSLALEESGFTFAARDRSGEQAGPAR